MKFQIFVKSKVSKIYIKNNFLTQNQKFIYFDSLYENTYICIICEQKINTKNFYI